jgi:hypothetical protein
MGLALGAFVCAAGCGVEDDPANPGRRNDGCPAPAVACACGAATCPNEHALCPFGKDACPPTLDAVLDPKTWESLAGSSSTLDECDDGVRFISVSYYEAGYSAAFDSSGAVLYEYEAPCNRLVCGKLLDGRDCRSCTIVPGGTPPPATGNAGEGGGSSTPGRVCELDENGALRVPR